MSTLASISVVALESLSDLTPVGMAWSREPTQSCTFDVSNLPSLTVREVPLVGGTDAGIADAELTTAFRITVARSGTVVVAERQRLVFFDSTGKFLRSVGRQGQGPGEFQALEFLGSLGDTVWAYDRRTQRISFFAPGGELLRTTPMPSLAVQGGEVSKFIGLLDGMLRIDSVYTPRDSTRSVRVVAQSLEGGPVHAISTELYVRPAIGPVMGGNSGTEVRRPWLDVRLVQPAPDGRAVVTIDRRTGVSNDTASITVRWLSPTGNARRECRYRFRPERLTERSVDSTVSYLARTYGTQLLGIAAGSAAEVAFAKSIRAQLPIPRFAPWVGGATVGADGSVLIHRDFQLGRYVLLGSDGRPRGVLTMPVNAQRNGDGAIYAVRQDAVWVRRVDEDGVPSVARYRITGGS
jgi:hypothetical protein